MKCLMCGSPAYDQKLGCRECGDHNDTLQFWSSSFRDFNREALDQIRNHARSITSYGPSDGSHARQQFITLHNTLKELLEMFDA